jgi:uncharacterized integral membrane protein
MSPKLIAKTLFMIVVLSLLVLMGMYNTHKVELNLPPPLPKAQKAPAALMYFGFFAVGLLTGTILTVGGKRGGGGGGGRSGG